MAIKGAGLTGKQVVKTIGKTAAVELMSNAAGYTVSYGCDELEMPLAVTWMLSVFKGCTVSASAGKYILKDANGLVKEINPEEAEDFLKKLASAEDVLEGGTPTHGYSNFADGMSPEDAARYIANNEKAFFNEFSERASKAGLNPTQITEAFDAMRAGDYTKMATYFDTSSPVDGAVFWSGNKEGAATYANSIGGTIMEQTPGGQVFDDWRGLQGMYPEWDTGTMLDQKPIWEAMSSQYANGAEGTSTYVHPSGYEGKVWSNIEKPILEGNDIIIQEVIIDAK